MTKQKKWIENDAEYGCCEETYRKHFAEGRSRAFRRAVKLKHKGKCEKGERDGSDISQYYKHLTSRAIRRCKGILPDGFWCRKLQEFWWAVT